MSEGLQDGRVAIEGYQQVREVEEIQSVSGHEVAGDARCLDIVGVRRHDIEEHQSEECSALKRAVS